MQGGGERRQIFFGLDKHFAKQVQETRNQELKIVMLFLSKSEKKGTAMLRKLFPSSQRAPPADYHGAQTKENVRPFDGQGQAQALSSGHGHGKTSPQERQKEYIRMLSERNR